MMVKPSLFLKLSISCKSITFIYDKPLSRRKFFYLFRPCLSISEALSPSIITVFSLKASEKSESFSSFVG